MTKLALLVGIDGYSVSPLDGCVADASALADLLEKNDDGSPNFACERMLSSKKRITRNLLRLGLKRLFRKERLDTALFFFAGHGSDNDALGGHLVTQDSVPGDEGVAMEQVIGLANRSTARERIIILDCCHAGAIGEILATGGDVPLAEGTSILAACRDTESAVESNGHGVFSTRLCDALRGGAADVIGKVSVAGVYAYIDEVSKGWEQRPLLKSNVSEVTVLRRDAPAVPLPSLRRITDYFENPLLPYPLDPSYEPTAEPRHAEHEAIFSELQAYRSARLVTPNETPHMYYAAMESKSCSLTALGRFYWHCVKNDQI